MHKRVLNLKREALIELSTDELTNVAGAAQALTVDGLTCPVKRCVTPPQSYEAYATCTCCTASASC